MCTIYIVQYIQINEGKEKEVKCVNRGWFENCANFAHVVQFN